MLDKDIENITLGALLTPPASSATTPQLDDKAVASNSEISYACTAGYHGTRMILVG